MLILHNVSFMIIDINSVDTSDSNTKSFILTQCERFWTDKHTDSVFLGFKYNQSVNQ